jgi:streptomycin 6-kinase
MDERLSYSSELVRNITGVYGEDGKAWLSLLPDLLAECERRWDITVQNAFPNLTFNYVASAIRSDASAAVLKAGVAGPELRGEIHALRAYDGHGAVRILEADDALGAFLIERIAPGHSLRSLDDDAEAARIAASVMRRLRAPVPATHLFPTIADWGRGFARLRARFGGKTGPVPADPFRRAETLFAELAASSDSPVLLHGDLHHDNILRSEMNVWVAIDPKGVIGEPAYEVGAFMRNWLPDILAVPNPQALIARRLDIFSSELSLPRQRLRDWSFAQAVLSVVWTIEDNGDDYTTLALAELLEDA